ncbi:MAG: hypothetical protein M3Y81_01690 [Chloroflexota bacterium]|nr:hypothetical protein [Chloroflexota bacterium]
MSSETASSGMHSTPANRSTSTHGYSGGEFSVTDYAEEQANTFGNDANEGGAVQVKNAYNPYATALADIFGLDT